jgi:hypothetical protein
MEVGMGLHPKIRRLFQMSVLHTADSQDWVDRIRDRISQYTDLAALDQSLDYPDQAKPATHPLTKLFKPTEYGGSPARFQSAWRDSLRELAGRYTYDGAAEKKEYPFDGASDALRRAAGVAHQKADKAVDAARDLYTVYAGTAHVPGMPSASIPELMVEASKRNAEWKEAGPAVEQAEEYMGQMAKDARDSIRAELTRQFLRTRRALMERKKL